MKTRTVKELLMFQPISLRKNLQKTKGPKILIMLNRDFCQVCGMKMISTYLAITRRKSEIRALCLIKWPSEMF